MIYEVIQCDGSKIRRGLFYALMTPEALLFWLERETTAHNCMFFLTFDCVDAGEAVVFWMVLGQ